jgi:hypothetical protein
VIFPELFGRVFAGDALEDLGAAWVLVNEIGNVVDRVVDDDVHALVGGVVGRDFGWRDYLGHLELLRDLVWSGFGVCALAFGEGTKLGVQDTMRFVGLGGTDRYCGQWLMRGGKSEQSVK